jgi:hypothetical protein
VRRGLRAPSARVLPDPRVGVKGAPKRAADNPDAGVTYRRERVRHRRGGADGCLLGASVADRHPGDTPETHDEPRTLMRSGSIPTAVDGALSALCTGGLDHSKKGGKTMEESTPGAGKFLGGDQGEDGDGTLSRYGRRAFMLAAGAAGAGMAATLASTDPAGAANNNPVELGDSNSASATTVITTSGGNGLNGLTTSDETYACGVLGESEYGIGVYGTQSSKSGLLGADGYPASAAVVGDTGDGVGVLGLSSSANGVSGITANTGSSGVAGIDNSTGGGYGIYGTSTNGDGIYGTVGGDNTGMSAVRGFDDSEGGGYGVFGVSAVGTGVQGVISGQTTGKSAVYGEDVSLGGGYGVYGKSYNRGTGVYGTQSASSGLLGSSGVPASAAVIGDSGSGVGVVGLSSTDHAVMGITSADGFSGVYAASTGGGSAALAVDGVATFSRSGVAAVAGTSRKSAQTVTVTGVALTSSSLILATPQGIVAGVAVEGVVPDVSGSSFVIHLTKSIKVSLDIAWFVVG